MRSYFSIYALLFMNKDKIKPFDLWRMIFGDAPPEYFIEVFFRGLALYLFMLFIMRWLGKRMAGELTVVEMVLILFRNNDSSFQK